MTIIDGVLNVLGRLQTRLVESTPLLGIDFKFNYVYSKVVLDLRQECLSTNLEISIFYLGLTKSSMQDRKLKKKSFPMLIL